VQHEPSHFTLSYTLGRITVLLHVEDCSIGKSIYFHSSVTRFEHALVTRYAMYVQGNIAAHLRNYFSYGKEHLLHIPSVYFYPWLSSMHSITLPSVSSRAVQHFSTVSHKGTILGKYVIILVGF